MNKSVNSSNHTPGPWKIREGFMSDTLEIFRPDETLKPPFSPAEIATINDIDNQAANARLIAAAPDLLALLQELQESASYWSEYDVPIGIVDRISEAIAKATGEPHVP